MPNIFVLCWKQQLTTFIIRTEKVLSLNQKQRRGLLMEIPALPTLFYCLIAFSTFLKFCIADDTWHHSPGQSIRGVQTLLSSGQVFELGFFSSGNKSSYLGRWYKKTPGTRVYSQLDQPTHISIWTEVFTISNNQTLNSSQQKKPHYLVSGFTQGSSDSSCSASGCNM